jgi:hypothetical protein
MIKDKAYVDMHVRRTEEQYLSLSEDAHLTEKQDEQSLQFLLLFV